MFIHYCSQHLREARLYCSFPSESLGTHVVSVALSHSSNLIKICDS